MEIIFNAEDCIAGRLASITAKEILKGKQVYIVNAEKAILSGDPDYNIRLMKEKMDRGDPYHGPFYPKRPDQVIKRFVKGMLPKKPRGRDALGNLKVFLAVPPELEGKDFKRPEQAHNKLTGKYTTLGNVAAKAGAKKTW